MWMITKRLIVVVALEVELRKAGRGTVFLGQ
jgi:hypothetical protein